MPDQNSHSASPKASATQTPANWIPRDKKPPGCAGSGRREIRVESFHQQHLARALDRVGQPALVVRGHAGILAGQDPTLIGHVLLEQICVLEIESVLGEVDFGLWARRAVFRGAAVASLVLVGVCLARHNYLISLWTVWRRRNGLNFLSSSFSVFSFLLRV